MMQYLDRLYFWFQTERWKWWTCTIILAVGIVALAEIETGMEQQRELAEDAVRFHVTAGDNTAEGQRLKLEVRDAVSEQLNYILKGADTAAEVRYRIRDNLGNLLRTAREVGGEDAWITFQKESFPTRYYNGKMYPAGEYETLRILLGSAGGHNWWSLLFPEDDDEEEREWIVKQDEEVKLRFWLLEWWEEWTGEWFGGD